MPESPVGHAAFFFATSTSTCSLNFVSGPIVHRCLTPTGLYVLAGDISACGSHLVASLWEKLARGRWSSFDEA